MGCHGECQTHLHSGRVTFHWRVDESLNAREGDDRRGLSIGHRQCRGDTHFGKILGEAGLARRLSRNARRSAERFEREIIVTRWEDLLERVQQTAR